jgi:uncharacterized protein YbaP (TraB family)
MRYFTLLLLCCFSFIISFAQPFSKKDIKKDNNSLLWEISGKDLKKPSYLYGTFHLMCKDDIQFSNNLKKAMSVSEKLYLEMDLDDPANTVGALMFMNMKDGKTLRDYYTPEAYANVKQFFFDSLKTSLQMFERMKPGFVSAMLYPLMMPCKKISGVEEGLMALAKTQSLTIEGLETIAFQSAILDVIPESDQAMEMLHMIDSIDKYKIQFAEMLKMYQSQNLASIEASFSNEPGFEKSKSSMLDNRNINWVNQLKSIMHENAVFIGVGAGHLCGDLGLIALLKKEGYTLKAIVNE